jgi:hypothetical protein
MIKHSFTKNIEQILKQEFDKNADEIFEKSLLIQYLNKKTLQKYIQSRSLLKNTWLVLRKLSIYHCLLPALRIP